MTSTAVADTAHPSLRERAHLPFAIGAVALVTLGAFENRAVQTILPTVAGELDGLWLYGAASAAPLITFVVSTTVAGLWADRRGPSRVVYAGMGLFVAAELVMGLAPAMVPFVAGRLLGGFAEGLLDVGLTVLIARALPPQLRPKMFATFAAAWVLPSLLGPSVAGFVAETVHWRAVYLLGVALLLPVALFLRPALGSPAAQAPEGTPHDARTGQRLAGWAVVVALGLAALTAGASLVTRSGWWGAVGGTVLVAALAVLVPSLRAVLPAGTLRAARGIPALTALRGLLGAAFGTVGGLLPLMLTQVHGYGPTRAGVSLTITGVFWAAGSQVQGLRVVQARTGAAARLRVGFALLTVGLAGPVVLSLELVPAWLGLAGWAVAATGIGIVSPTVSTQVHGYGPTRAGVSLTITGVFWAAGSQVQGLRVVQARTGAVARLRVGFALLTLGLAGPVVLSLELVPAWLGLAGWAVAATGIGIVSPTVSTQVLALSSDADQGRNSAASILAPAVTQAAAFALAGAAIAWREPDLTGGLFATIMAPCALGTAVAYLLSGRAR